MGFVLCSVPQGLVLGPRLFVLYTAALEEVTDQHKVNLHSYADNSHLYVHCQCHDTASTVACLEHCVDDIGHCMAANRLQMNPAKTELLWAGSKHNISVLRSHAPALQLCSDTVTASGHVQVLRVTVLSDLSVKKHVSKTCTACFHWLHQLRRIRKSIDGDSAATLVHTFVTSRVDSTTAMHSMQGRRIHLGVLWIRVTTKRQTAEFLCMCTIA